MKHIFSIGTALLICSTAAMAQYTNVLENGLEQTVTNMWTTNTVWVGDTTSSNTLNVAVGGVVSCTDVYVGATSNANANLISMTGTSRWDIADALIIGEGQGNEVSVTDGSVLTADRLDLNSGNTLTVDGGGAISNLTSMNVYSNTTINGTGMVGFGTNDAALAFYGKGIDLDAGIVFSANSNANNTLSYFGSVLDVANESQFEHFDKLVLDNSDLTGTGVLNAFGSVEMTGGSINPAGDDMGSLHIDGSFSASDTMYNAQVGNATNDVLSFTDSVDLTELNLDLKVSGTYTGAVTILSSTGGLSNDFATADITSRPLLYTAVLQITNDEVQVVLAQDTSVQLSSALDFAATESVWAGFSGMKNLVFTRTKQLRRNLVSTSHAIPNDVFLLTTTNTPAGAMGPGDQNTIFDMHVWMQQYGGQGDYNRIGVSDAFTQKNYGTTIGADKLVGDDLAVGLNYTYGRSKARVDNGDRLDTESYWIGAYGEWVGVDGLYVDALAGYGYTSFDSERFAASYHGTASYSGQSFGAYADVGQYYSYGENLALSPYMGVHALSLMIDAHDETEDAGSVIHVDQVDHNWLESALGLKIRHRFDTGIGRFQTTGYAEWTYDFIQDDVYSSLSSGGLASAETIRISPDESGINAGLGYSWICTDYMEIGVGYNGRFSANREEHTGSFMLDIMF